MSTGLTVYEPLNMSLSLGTEEDFGHVSKSAEFLSRLQLYTKGKAIDKGKIRPGHFGIPESGEEITDLGDRIDIIPYAKRTKAIDMSDKDAIITVYDFRSDEFKRIQSQAQEKESNCMYGPSFLVYERSHGRWLEFFCGSKSTRGEAGKIYPYMNLTQAEIEAKAANGANMEGVEPHGPLPLTLTSRLVEKGSYSWHVPVVNKCSTPFPRIPSYEEIMDEAQKFLNVKSDGSERATESDTRKSRAR